VTWTVDNTFVEELRLQRRVNRGGAYGAWEDLPAQGRSTTTFDDYGLKPGASYQYRVQACNSRGCSAYASSNAFVAPAPPRPAAPASLEAYAMGNYMYLVWGDVANETTYELQRRQQNGAVFGEWSAPIVRTMNTTSDQDPITPGAVYQYRIRACNQGGCSAYTSSTPTQS
jgi:predicted phage tail protein